MKKYLKFISGVLKKAFPVYLLSVLLLTDISCLSRIPKAPQQAPLPKAKTENETTPSKRPAVRPPSLQVKQPPHQGRRPSVGPPQTPYHKEKSSLVAKYGGLAPHMWGEKIPGVITRINTTDKIVALTFDACGGRTGSGYDRKLIAYLTKERVPATLFINARWIDANYNTFMSLAKNPLFEIENHGFWHKPLSVNGKSAYGIRGTASPSEVVDEVMLNQFKIERLIGRKTKFFRSGTDFYDDVAVKIVRATGQYPVGFSVLGDAGATYTREQIKNACQGAKPGSLIIFHMNHPEKQTAAGVMAAVPELRKRGFRFVKLQDYAKYLK